MKPRKTKTPWALTLLIAVTVSACGGGGPGNMSSLALKPGIDPGVRRASSSWSVDALIFDGPGAATADTQSIASILDGLGMSWQKLGPTELANLSSTDLLKYGMIVFPGGYAKDMSDSLSPQTRENIHRAVVDGGLGYIGFCAGAFISSDYGSWGLGVTSMQFPYYYLEDQGVTAQMVDVRFPDGSTRNLLWYGGPELNGFGQPLAKNPDGTAAIAQAWIGKGFVILSGPHPEGPQQWRDAFGLTDRDGLDFDLAGRLFEAVLKQKPLPGFNS